MGSKFVVQELEEVHRDGRLRHTRRIETATRGRPTGGYKKVFGPATKAACQEHVARIGELQITAYKDWHKRDVVRNGDASA